MTPGGTEAKFGRRVREGELIYELFLKNTDPSLVFFEMDVYWAVMGQQDPIQWLKNYKDRIKVLHIKDRAVLGDSGMMNFEKIFAQAAANGIKDYFVELERMPDGRTQFEGVKKGFPLAVEDVQQPGEKEADQKKKNQRCVKDLIAAAAQQNNHQQGHAKAQRGAG